MLLKFLHYTSNYCFGSLHSEMDITLWHLILGQNHKKYQELSSQTLGHVPIIDTNIEVQVTLKNMFRTVVNYFLDRIIIGTFLV